MKGRFNYCMTLVIRHSIWDQGTAGLPKTTNYWKSRNKFIFISLFFLISYIVARPTPYSLTKVINFYLCQVS
jgi:hypothetical protein